ncbi:DUF4835 family protein [Taibaiella lutea]|uniref:DUF4835 family protein n=1 Tax=Taibaiella lutea TaxID=2608001 RepID=A0A5M6CCU8_9BACT|nr:DUF4835 family protein [Taibaiella lutea]KAA5532280.1 DUF4835 family protein [Taibaiella lutea]
MMRKLFISFIGLLLATNVMAQDLKGIVEVNADRIQNVDPKVFDGLKKALNEFINNRKWTADNIKPAERIECNFLLTITKKAADDNIFEANLNIQSSRPVFGSGYNSPMVNYIDRDVTFRFDQGQTLQFDDARVSGNDALSSNLTAIFAYYAYLIVGFDYESFSLKGGDDYFKKAQNVVSNAPEDTKAIKGWKAAENNRNRYWLIDQILNPRFAAFRPLYYSYHRKGLDMMSTKPEEARKVILDGIPTLTQINNDNPTSIFFQFYFNAKSIEYQNILMQTPVADRKDYVEQLCKMDVPNTSKYRSIR